MVKKFLNLKLKTKLLIAFVFISSILLVQGVYSYISLTNQEKGQDEILKSVQVSNAAADIKFTMAHDLKILMELISTTDQKDLEEFWKQHQELSKNFNGFIDALNTVVTDSTWGQEYADIKRGFKASSDHLNDFYTKRVDPTLTQVHGLRLQQLTRGLSEDSVQKLQNIIDVLDNDVDAESEVVFTDINKFEKETADFVKKIEELSSERALASRTTNILFVLSGFILSIIIALSLANFLVKIVNKLNQSVQLLSKGELPQTIEKQTTDEMGQMIESVNQLTSGLRKTSEFADEIGKGKLDVEFKPLSQKDVLGNSLVNMRANLVQVKEDEKRRAWVTQGLAKFADILRTDTNNITKFYDNIIANLVRYMSANQGGLYVIAEDAAKNKYLELASCYAFQKKKFVTKKIEMGEGLVGQCLLEGDTVFMTEVPEDYIEITSGLGDAPPRCILIVPLKVNDVTYGVVELAAFTPFEKYQIEFVEKVGESIASTVSAVKVNAETKQLLEVSQQQSEEMKAQEEEMRQNLEEMQATQEEMQRKEMQMKEMLEKAQQQEEEMRQNMEEMQATQEEMDKQNVLIAEKAAETRGVLDGINATMATIEFTPDGTIITANDNFLKAMKTQLSDIKGVHHRNFVPPEIANSADYKNFWSLLASGIEQKGEFKRINGAGEEVWLNAIYNPIRNAAGQVIKVVKFATDITAEKEKERLNKAQTDIIDSVAIVSKTDLKGNITYVNDEFLKWSKYTKEELMGKNHRILKSGEQDDAIFVEMWKTISSGKIFRGEVKNKAKDGSFYWVDAIIAPVLDENGKPIEYIGQRFVINEQKNAQEESKVQLKVISANMAIMEYTPDGTIINANENFLKILKCKLEDIKGKHDAIIVPKEIAESNDYKNNFWKNLNEGKENKAILKRCDIKGEVIWLNSLYNPIKNTDGKVVKVINFALDVTSTRK